MATFKYHIPVLDCYPRTPSVPISPHSQAYHTAFLLRAAESIAKLVDIPRGSSTHTPLFNFCLFLSASTYLAASPLLSASQENSLDGNILGTSPVQIKRQLGFEISALKKMSKVWPSAKQMVEDIQSLSLQYFNPTSPPKSSPGSSDAMTDIVSNGNISRHPSVGAAHPSLMPPNTTPLGTSFPGMTPTSMQFEMSPQPFGSLSRTDSMSMEFPFSESSKNIYGSYGSDGSHSFRPGKQGGSDWDPFADLSTMAVGQDSMTSG